MFARGILLYGTNPQAIADFEKAVEHKHALVWPYLFLAHNHLLNGRFEECRTMCETGPQTQGSDTAKSQLEEWRAIAQAQLGFPPEQVKAGFESALRLDPSNDLARRNKSAYEASLMPADSRHSLVWEKKACCGGQIVRVS